MKKTEAPFFKMLNRALSPTSDTKLWTCPKTNKRRIKQEISLYTLHYRIRRI